MIKLKIKYGNSQTDIRFPCTEKEMNAALERIHAEDVTPLELYVSEVIFPEELGCLQDRFVNLDEVNFLGKRMDSFFGDEEYQFYEAMKLEGFDTLPDLINLSFNLNRYPLIRDIGDMGKIGREYLLTVKGCLPVDDADDPKYAELGRELIQSGNGIFTEHGLLFVDEDTPFQRPYDGQTFPAYLYDPGVLCVAKAEYDGKTEYLYFPCEEEAIDKAFTRLGTTADGIHSIDPASEFYITIYGSIAQSESENISANVKWGKAQSAKQGNVPFQCKHFLGYTKNADGEIEIVPEEAEIIREIYEQYLSGESLYGIKCYLEAKEIPTPAGCSVWRQETIRSILSNEKYKGDAIINKTYVSDCISKRVKANNGERNKYYIENNHPAIIDAGTFARVQEEIARRSGKPKVKQKGTKTELSRYSSRYALSELLICGECRTPYRRCTWTAKGKRKIVWRCINRLDYGKKYCHHSPSIEENLLQDAVMRAIMQTAKQNIEVLKTLKIHIGMGLTDEVTEDKTLDIQIRIAEINAEFQKMLKAVSADNADGIDEERITELMNEKQRLTVQLEQYAAMRQKRESAKSRLDEIYTILDGLQNHPMEYDDKLVRQIIECVVVESKEKIKVVFIGGTEIEMTL